MRATGSNTWTLIGESPPGLEILAGVRGELRAIFDDHAHFLHLRDRLPIHVGRSEVEVALIEDPDLLVHDAAAPVPLAHLDRVDRDPVGKVRLQRIRLLLVAEEARAL